MSAAGATLQIEATGTGAVRVSGRLGVANAAAALARDGELRPGAGIVEVDTGGLEGLDSVALAVLLAWSARAANAGVQLRYRNLPAGLAALAEVSGATRLLVGGTTESTAPA